MIFSYCNANSHKKVTVMEPWTLGRAEAVSSQRHGSRRRPKDARVGGDSGPGQRQWLTMATGPGLAERLRLKMATGPWTLGRAGAVSSPTKV
jgi:hypothetical protein